MAKPYTMLTAVLMFIVAAIHAYRLYSGFPAVIDGHDVPMWVSGVVVAVGAFLGVMLLREARR